MATQDKIRAHARAYLGDGEHVVSAFPAQSMNPNFFVLLSIIAALANFGGVATVVVLILMACAGASAIWFLIKNKNFAIIATTERTLVGRSTTLSANRVDSIAYDVASDVLIGPHTGFMYKTSALGPELHIHRRFRKEVEDADNR